MDAAKPRIESLNPLVTVETVANGFSYQSAEFESLIERVDLVCITDESKDRLVRSSFPTCPVAIERFGILNLNALGGNQ